MEEALSTIVRLASLPRSHERLLTDAGLRIDRATFQALRQIADRPTRVTDLAEVLGLDLSTVSRTVKRLESLGLVERHSMAADGRARLLQATAKGESVLTGLKAAKRRYLEEILAEWAPDDLATLAELLSRLADDVQSREEQT